MDDVELHAHLAQSKTVTVLKEKKANDQRWSRRRRDDVSGKVGWGPLLVG